MTITTWTLRDESGTEALFSGTLEEARERADEWARGGYDAPDPEHGTIWCDVAILDADGDEVETVTVAIDPDEPDCSDGCGHEWVSDGASGFGTVVCGHGGGVVCRSVCARCGVRRISDSWAQRPDTGEQGLDSVSYRDGDPPLPAYWESVSEDGEVGEVRDCGLWRARVGARVLGAVFDSRGDAEDAVAS